MNIGERLKEIRVAKGLTQVDLSNKSGIAIRTVQRIENNEVKPSIYSLNAISKVLDIKLNSEIFTDNNKKFEVKLVVSNFSNLLLDLISLLKRNWIILLFLFLILLGSILFKDLKRLIVNWSDYSTISVSTINCDKANECDIELIKSDEKGDVVWRRIIGGTSYDKAGQVIKTEDGDFLLVGSTSSFGKGNYDVLVVKISSKGEIIWQKTYGDFLNDYGSRISITKDGLYQIEGSKQICKTVNVSNDCYNQEWIFKIDESGILK